MNANLSSSLHPRALLTEILSALQAAELVDPIDVQLATTFVRRSVSPVEWRERENTDTGEPAASPALAAALATVFTSRARREGHSAITLAQLAEQAAESRAVATLVYAEQEGAFEDERSLFPEWLAVHEVAWWKRMLGASPLVDTGVDTGVGTGVGVGASADVDASTSTSTSATASITPLVLRDELLQFTRYADAEMRIAERVRALVAEPSDHGVPAFSIVTGGPGTGKTTHVAKRLLELQQSAPSLRIALAAPTGKAAARLTESISQRLAAIMAETGERVPLLTEARTLHRLLGYSPGRDRFRQNADDPLDHDLIIVDEASMIDVLMMDALLSALKPGARLMLVGDHHQLASVDAGDVLGALCRAALASAKGSPLRESVTLLTRSWRFEQQPAIGAIAGAILRGESDGVLRVCADARQADVQLREHVTGTESLLEPLVPQLNACLAAESPEAMLSALEAFRILAPEREGRVGVQGLNSSVERWLARRGHAVHEPWYHGRPVLVTANDYTTGVFNGDLGVVWRDAGHVAVYFRGVDGALKAIAPIRLPASETAWAMTVHKSQGSEFDHVMIVLPERESRVMSRELLYTAVTRARRRVVLAGSAAAVASAVSRPTGRTSGLDGWLGA